MTPNSLRLLLDLQSKDLTLLQLKKESQGLPARKETLEKSLKAVEAERAAAEASVQEKESAIRQLELDVEGVQAKINKYKTQQMEAKTNEEFKAFNREIATARDNATAMEDDELVLMGELEELKSAVSEAKTREEGAKAELADQVSVLDERLETIKATFAEVKAEREALAAEIDADILKTYMDMLLKRQEAVLVPVQQVSCGGCHMRLSPQVLHDAHSGMKWTSCGFCGRYLYDPEVTQSA